MESERITCHTRVTVVAIAQNGGDNHHGPAPGALYDRGTAEFDIGTVHRRIHHARGYDHCGYSRLEREGNLTIYLPQQTRHLSRKPA